MNLKSTQSVSELGEDYNNLQRNKARKKITLSSSNASGTASGDLPLNIGAGLNSRLFESKSQNNALGFFESGLFPVGVDEQFTFSTTDDEKIILHGKLEPCRYKLCLDRLTNSNPEPVSIHIEALELSLDFEAVMTAKEQKCSKEFNLFKKDGEVQRDNLITVMIKVSRQTVGAVSSFGFQLFKKKDVVYSTPGRINLKQFKKIQVSNVDAGIYEVLVHPVMTYGSTPLNVKISAFEEKENDPNESQGTSFLDGGVDLSTIATKSYLHHEVSHGVAQTSDWFSERFIIYGRSNMTTKITAHISVMINLTKGANLESASNVDYRVFVYRVGDDTPVMEISQHELGQLCTHLVSRIFYAYNVKKSLKELDDIIAVCDSYGTVKDNSKKKEDEDSVSVRPEPMIKVREIAISKRDQLKEFFRRKREIQKGIEEKNLSLLMNYVRDHTFEEVSPLSYEAQQVVKEMEAKTKFENEIAGILQQEAERLARKHPHYELKDIITEKNQTIEKFYNKVIKEEKENGGKNCGPMSYLLKTFYESIQLVEQEINAGHLEKSKKELLAKQLVWKRIAQISSDPKDKEDWKVKMDPDEDEDFFFDDDYKEESDEDLYMDDDDAPMKKKKKENTPGSSGNLLGKFFSSFSATKPKSNLNIGEIALMGFALFNVDQMVRKEGDQDMLVLKLNKDQFNSLYRVAQFVIKQGLKHVKKNAMVQDKLGKCIASQLSNTIEYTVNSSVAEKYLNKEEIVRVKKILFALGDKNETKFESLLTKNELAMWKERKQNEQNSSKGAKGFISLLQLEPQKIIDKDVGQGTVVKSEKDLKKVVDDDDDIDDDDDSDTSLNFSSDEEDDDEAPKASSSQKNTNHQTPAEQDVVEEEDEIVINYNIAGIDTVEYPNLTDPDQFASIFVNQVNCLNSYLETQAKLKQVSVASLCDETNSDSFISAYMRKAVLPSFRALFIGPQEDPAELFVNEEAYNFNYMLDVARSGVQNPAVAFVIEGIFKVQKEITVEDLWLEDPDHFKSTRFNAFWCHCFNSKKALIVFDEVCSSNYYSAFFKRKPKFVEPAVRVAMEKLSKLPLVMSCDAWLNQYDPGLLENAEEEEEEASL